MREKRGRGWKEGLCKEGRREREEGLSKGGRRRWREGVRQVGGYTVTVHVGDKNDLLIPFLPPFSPFSPFSPSLLSLLSLLSLPPLPFLPPLSHQLHKSSTGIYMTPARDEISLYAQFRAIKIKQISRDAVKCVALTPKI